MVGGGRGLGRKAAGWVPWGRWGWEEDEGGKVVTSQLSTGFQRERVETSLTRFAAGQS